MNEDGLFVCNRTGNCVLRIFFYVFYVYTFAYQQFLIRCILRFSRRCVWIPSRQQHSFSWDGHLVYNRRLGLHAEIVSWQTTPKRILWKRWLIFDDPVKKLLNLHSGLAGQETKPIEKRDLHRAKRKGIGGRRWPDNTVHYEFTAGFCKYGQHTAPKCPLQLYILYCRLLKLKIWNFQFLNVTNETQYRKNMNGIL